MAGNQTVASSAIVDSRPPPQPVGDAPKDHGTMAMQAGGCSARVQYVRATDLPASHSPGDGHIGPWEKILSFFGIRKPAPVHDRPQIPDRPHIPDRRHGPDQALPEHRVEAVPVEYTPPPPAETKPATPFPILKLPFELLCEVIARVPAADRHFFRGNTTLGTTCKAFHAAINAVSNMEPHRADDAIARRISGMMWGSQIPPTIEELAKAKPSVREWALQAVMIMATGMSVTGRRDTMMLVLQRARKQSALWELELMRHLARWLPDTDSELLTLLTERVLRHDAKSDDEHLAKARVLAQLAQRISPNDLPGTVRRWESIYKAVSDHPRHEDVLTVRGLRAAFDHLTSDTFNCKFSVESEGTLLCKLIWLYRAVDSLRSKEYMAACTEGELALRRPPEPLPGTVKKPDPLRAYSSIMTRPIPRIDRLPSHIM
ncbi:F-box domain-containing protein [Cupriavidus gilardii]|uniref:F-box protein n=1 Tax=Cupriavidus gilardii TaxID=82541 RepID=UPI001EE59AA7|nr:F-box protein [Cupriavidus gilardii]MCG5261220.1 F-box protein [Cupriavidus gilardii]MDF9428492.1 F-box domain-containing protein [Cupriavidus gilardii]